MRIKVAAVQANSVIGRVPDNLRTYTGLINEACGTGAQIVALPELFTTGYTLDKDVLLGVAEPIPGPTTRHLERIAQKWGAFIAGCIAESEGQHLYNTSVLVGPHGLIGKHRKIMLWGPERTVFTPGNEANPLETPYGRVGLMVCRDTSFGEVARTLALKGAFMLIAAHADTDLSVGGLARALDNSCYVLSANLLGEGHGMEFCGNSRVVSPEGRVLAQADGSPGFAIAEIDTAEVERVRSHRNYLTDYRKELFQSESFYR